jgi:hypothetical protein
MSVAGVSTISSGNFYKFRALVNSRTGLTETKCGPYLKYVSDFLAFGTPRTVLRWDFEDRNFFGSTDFIVSASMETDIGRRVTTVFIWELKAPQCHVLEPDGTNKNRYRPTRELIKAETQLLHYYNYALGDRYFADRYGVEVNNIRLGGIIIGCQPDRFARNAKSEAEIKAAVSSLSLRQKYLYDPNGVRVVTWDRITRRLEGFEKKRAPKTNRAGSL